MPKKNFNNTKDEGERLDEILKAEENLKTSGEEDDLELSGGNEFSEMFAPRSSGSFSSSMDKSEGRRENLEQMQPEFDFERKEKKEEKKEEFQDYSTAYESTIRHAQDIIAPIDDMRRMNMFLDMRSADRVVDARPTVNLPVMQEMQGMQNENRDVVKYAEHRKDPWMHDLTEADKHGDVRKYFRPKA